MRTNFVRLIPDSILYHAMLNRMWELKGALPWLRTEIRLSAMIRGKPNRHRLQLPRTKLRPANALRRAHPRDPQHGRWRPRVPRLSSAPSRPHLQHQNRQRRDRQPVDRRRLVRRDRAMFPLDRLLQHARRASDPRRPRMAFQPRDPRCGQRPLHPSLHRHLRKSSNCPIT